VLYLVLEGVRKLIGPPGVFGNHVVIQADDGTCVLLAHLRRRSLRVERGERVAAGQPVAGCGNSFNSSEPHLHVQVVDGPRAWTATALPVRVDGTPPPSNGDHVIYASDSTSLGRAP
jgi:murein DD-endopeptidase MepM/ murein hydrolase activator NlpD